MSIKKISQEKKSPIRFIYENLYGTSITPKDEVYYIWICLHETFKIVCLNFYETLSKSL